jgi:hypothetical protein
MKSSLVAAAFASALGLGIAAAPAPAHDPKKHILIKRVAPDGKPMRLERVHAAKLLTDCRKSDRAESNVKTGDGKEKHRTFVVICTKDGAANTPETRRKLADALERARNELGEHEGITPERRAGAAAALDREIARLRGEGRD